MGRNGARSDVELVEDDVPDGTPSTGLDTEASERRHRNRRRAVVAGAALLVVLTAGALVGQAVVTARERDRMAALADVPGVLDVLDGPVEAVRTTDDPALDPFSTRTLTPSGEVLSFELEDSGRTTVRAVEPSDGTVRWQTELLGPGTALTVPRGGETVAHEATCAGLDDGRVACYADNGLEVMSNASRVVLLPTVSRLVILDGRDGTVSADLSDGLGDPRGSVRLVTLGDLVVVAGARDATGYATALTTDGVIAWETTFPVTRTTTYGIPLEVRAVGDRLAVLRSDSLLLLDADGGVVQEVALGAQWGAAGVVGDTLVLRGVVRAETALVDPAGDMTTLPGQWVDVDVDDGSVPGLLLTAAGDGLHAWSPDGTERWVSELRTGRSALVVDGRVVVAHGVHLVALDAGTGAEMWRVEELLPEAGILTDGRTVVTMAPRPGGAEREIMVGIDAAGGDVAWRVTLERPVDLLDEIGGVLVAVTLDFESTDDVGLGALVTVLR